MVLRVQCHPCSAARSIARAEQRLRVVGENSSAGEAGRVRAAAEAPRGPEVEALAGGKGRTRPIKLGQQGTDVRRLDRGPVGGFMPTPKDDGCDNSCTRYIRFTTYLLKYQPWLISRLWRGVWQSFLRCVFVFSAPSSPVPRRRKAREISRARSGQGRCSMPPSLGLRNGRGRDPRFAFRRQGPRQRRAPTSARDSCF
jgi:hypothetical protein